MKEIPIVDIESIERVENELKITWGGVAYTFVSEKAELVEAIYEKVTVALKEQSKAVADKEVVSQTQSDLLKTLRIAIEIVDSLFDILRSLQGQVEWKLVESYLNRSEKSSGDLTFQNIEPINLDFTKLSLAIQGHYLKETSKESYDILKLLFGYFSGLTSKNEIPEDLHPNFYDAKAIILAYYTLNDIILGVTVEDKDIGKEINEFEMTLSNLSKEANLNINFDAIKGIINKLCKAKEKENTIEETRAIFMQQLSELVNQDMNKHCENHETENEKMDSREAKQQL